LVAGVYVVQVYNLIISPPLAPYLRATRFRLGVVYVAHPERPYALCVSGAYYVHVVRERVTSHRIASRRVASRRVASRRAASRAPRRCERCGWVLVIDSGSDYLWLYALLDRRAAPCLPSPGNSSTKGAARPRFYPDRIQREEEVDLMAFASTRES